MKGKPTLADQILAFLSSLRIPSSLPKGVTVLNPYQDPSTLRLCNQFYHHYYNDTASRRLILGINPGRLGGGLTGIPFTDPLRLEKFCGIENALPKKAELSSTFIYEMISAFGGPEKFYSKLYFSSLSPLGFVKEGKNLNYYDDAELKKKLEPFIVSCITTQLDFGIDRGVAYCLGEGENFKFLKQLNERHRFFKAIVPLAHPRYIMQYKSKSKAEYIQRYIDAFDFTPGKDVS
jgi:hypothetical protein